MSAKRPQQNSDGQKKQPSANPNGEAKPTPNGQAPSTAPHAALPQQLQLRINYASLAPADQAQVAQQQLGIDPFAMQKQSQASAQQAQQLGMQGDPHGPVPNTLQDGAIPEQAGVGAFPHDFAALVQLMQRGYSPGANPAEHAMAQNAHAIARAQERMAVESAQNVGTHNEAAQQLGGILQRLVMAQGAGAPSPAGY